MGCTYVLLKHWYDIILLYRFSKQHMLLAGLWFDTHKPTMSTFLYPLMISLNRLYLEGKLYVNVIAVIMVMMLHIIMMQA